MTNKERIEQHNAELQECIALAENLPDAGGGGADDSNYEVYEGSYIVTPSVSNQTLNTANKLMKSDVIIEEIPYAEVGNNSGGKTVTIGS